MSDIGLPVNGDGDQLKLVDIGGGKYGIAVVQTGYNAISCGIKEAGTDAARITTDSTPSNEVLIQADPDNTVAVFIGNATAQPIKLNAGGYIPIPVNDVSLLYVKTASVTANVNWLAR